MITLSLQWRIAGDDGNKGKEEFQVGEGRRERKEVYVWPCSSEQPERIRQRQSWADPLTQGRRGCRTVQTEGLYSDVTKRSH